jgi:hypothetical protein
VFNMAAEDSKQSSIHGKSCQNPLFKARDHTEKIEVNIMIKGQVYAICSSCWRKMNDHRREDKYQWSSV